MGQLANQTERKITFISFIHRLYQSKLELSIFTITYLFWLHQVFVAGWAFSSCGAQASLVVASLVEAPGL